MALVEPLLLGVDIGTSGVKGVLMTPGGRVVAEAEVTHSVSSPRPDWAEHDAERTWWQGLVTVVRRLLSSMGRPAGSVAAVGLSALCPAFVLTDERGAPLRAAILYGIDARAYREIEMLRPVIGEATLRRCGSPLTTHSVVPKLLWLKEHEPDTYRRASRLFTANGYAAWRLCGRHVMDRKTACSAGLLDLDSYEYALDLAARAGVRSDWFGELAWPTEVVGRVGREAAAETGLPEGTPVVIGTCDVVAEAVGAGVSQEGDLLVVFGSSVSFLMLTRGVVRDKALFSSVYVQPGLFYVGGSTGAAGTLTRWFVDRFVAGAGGASPGEPGSERREVAPDLAVAFNRLTQQAVEIPPGSAGLLVLPYWTGARTPRNDPKASGVIVGLRTRHTAAHVYRALMESVGYELRECLGYLSRIGLEASRILCTGGGARDRVWMQLVSDILGRKLDCLTGTTAPRGAAIMAGVGAGVIPALAPETVPAGTPSEWPGGLLPYSVAPRPDSVSIYQRYYELWLELSGALGHVMHGLHDLGEAEQPSS